MGLRRIFFTWNNWQDDFKTKDDVKSFFETDSFKGAVVGFEVGEKGTHHLQGVAFFTKQIDFKSIRTLFKNNHIEKIISLDNALNYCKKTGDFFEVGKVGSQGSRTDLEDFRDAIIEDMSDIDLLQNYPHQFFKYERMINKVRLMYKNDYYSKNQREVKVIYLTGKAGVGKTRFIYDNYDINDVYRVSNYDHPFDEYQGQKILVLDEFNSSIELRLLLNILDRYPLQLPARYANKWACYETVFIISNIDFTENYRNIQADFPEVFEALKRRIDKYFILTDVSRKDVYDKIKEFVNNTIDLPF